MVFSITISFLSPSENGTKFMVLHSMQKYNVIKTSSKLFFYMDFFNLTFSAKNLMLTISVLNISVVVLNSTLCSFNPMLLKKI